MLAIIAFAVAAVFILCFAAFASATLYTPDSGSAGISAYNVANSTANLNFTLAPIAPKIIILQQPSNNTGDYLPHVLFPTKDEVKNYIDSEPIKNFTVLSDGNTGNISNVQTAASGSKVFVVWQDNTSGNYDIYLSISYDGGLSFVGPVNLSNNTGNSTDPQIGAMDSDVQVLWQDDTPGNSDIFISTSADWGETFRTYNLSNSTTNSVSPRLSTEGKYPVWLWEEEFCPPPSQDSFPTITRNNINRTEQGGNTSAHQCYDVLYAHSRFW